MGDQSFTLCLVVQRVDWIFRKLRFLAKKRLKQLFEIVVRWALFSVIERVSHRIDHFPSVDLVRRHFQFEVEFALDMRLQK